MQAAPSNGGCTCVGFFRFRDFLHSDTHCPALVLINNATEQRTARIRLNIHLWPTWSPSSLLRFLAAGKDDPVGLYLYPARSQKKLAVCLNSTSISDIELFFSIFNSKVDLKSPPWRYPWFKSCSEKAVLVSSVIQNKPLFIPEITFGKLAGEPVSRNSDFRLNLCLLALLAKTICWWRMKWNHKI